MHRIERFFLDFLEMSSTTNSMICHSALGILPQCNLAQFKKPLAKHSVIDLW